MADPFRERLKRPVDCVLTTPAQTPYGSDESSRPTKPRHYLDLFVNRERVKRVVSAIRSRHVFPLPIDWYYKVIPSLMHQYDNTYTLESSVGYPSYYDALEAAFISEYSEKLDPGVAQESTSYLKQPTDMVDFNYRSLSIDRTNPAAPPGTYGRGARPRDRVTKSMSVTNDYSQIDRIAEPTTYVNANYLRPREFPRAQQHHRHYEPVQDTQYESRGTQVRRTGFVGLDGSRKGTEAPNYDFETLPW